jgi:ABC-2 type transport system ATP-binding protein
VTEGSVKRPARALTVQDLTKVYPGGKRAVDRVSFTAAGGMVLGLVGPNGAGKTTTLLCIAGLTRATSGTVTLGGERVAAPGGHIVYLPETPTVYPHLTVWEHLEFSARAWRLEGPWRSRADSLLARLALDGERASVGSELSKGLKQRLLLACALLVGPEVLLVDEPLVGLDPAGQREMRQLIRDVADSGTTVVLSSHQLPVVEALAGRVVILVKGRVAAQGSLDDLRHGDTADLEEIFLQVTTGRAADGTL